MKENSIDTYSLGLIPSKIFSVFLSKTFLLLPGSLLSGLLVFYILSHVLVVPLRIVIPLAIILSFLIFGLTRYYCCDFRTKKIDNDSHSRRSKVIKIDESSSSKTTKTEITKHSYGQENMNNALFIILYVILIAIVGLGSFGIRSFDSINHGIFIPWEQFFSSFGNMLYLLATICLCFFMPGHAIYKIISDKNNSYIAKSALLLTKYSLPKFLVAYLLSMLVTGLTVYIIAAEVESCFNTRRDHDTRTGWNLFSFLPKFN